VRWAAIAKRVEEDRLEDEGPAPTVDPSDAVAVLAADVADGDSATERVFRSYRLPEAAYRDAHEELKRRRERRSKRPLESEARYVCSILRSRGAAA